MALLKPYRKFNELPRVNASPFIFSSSTPAATFREAVWVEAKAQGKVEMKERKVFRFVRVNDRLFKVGSHSIILRKCSGKALLLGTGRILHANAAENAVCHQVLCRQRLDA